VFIANLEIPWYVFEDFSLGEISGRYSGTYTVTANTSVRTQSESSTSGSSCSSSNSGSDADNFNTATLNITRNSRITFRGLAEADTSATCILFCSGTTSGSASADLVIRDTTSGSTVLTIASASTGNSCTTPGGSGNSNTNEDHVYEIRTVDVLGRLEVYEDNILAHTVNYDSTHNYELRGQGTANSQTFNDGDSRGTATVTIFAINSSGVRGQQTGNFTWSNGTFESSDIANFSSDLISARITAIDNIPSSGAIQYYLSADNGTNWELVSNKIVHTFQNNGQRLRYRIAVNGTNSQVTDDDETTIYKIEVEVSQGFPENITIDVGQDNIIDFEWNGTLEPDNGTVEVNISSGAIDNYINKNCLNASSTTCLIPFDIKSGASGNLNYSAISSNLTLEGIRLGEINLTDFAVKENIVNISVRSNSSGIVQLGELDIIYIGEENITIFAHFDGSENISSANATLDISVRYSPFNITFPPGLTTWELILNNLTQYNVTPFGQIIDLNESIGNITSDSLNNSLGIFNITSFALTDPIDIVSSFNDTVNSCVNLTLSYSLEKDAGRILNETDQEILSGINSTTSNSTGIYMFGDFECSAVNLRFFNPTIRLKSYCADCVFPTDINGLNFSLGDD